MMLSTEDREKLVVAIATACGPGPWQGRCEEECGKRPSRRCERTESCWAEAEQALAAIERLAFVEMKP